MTVRVAVIGGGVSGLTSAHALRSALGADAVLDVWEAAQRPGGLLCTRTVDGVSMDVGAEAFIVRRPEALALVRDLGLGDQVVAPGRLRPAIWSGERLHPLPAPAVMGVPSTAAALGDLVDDDTRARIETEHQRPWSLPRTGLSVGELVRDRFGAQVLARSVDPMLGGVYSARADDLGVAETMAPLAAAIAEGAPSLTAAVTAVGAASAGATGPVFGALRGGYQSLVAALEAASGATIRTGSPVTAVEAWSGGYTVRTADDGVRYDAVVVAVPPWSAGPLIAGAAPEVSALLTDVRPAGSAVVGMVLAPGTAVPEHSGVLMASDADLAVKAVTLSTQKWPHLRRSGPPTLRVSFGRLGAPVHATDDELIALARRDLARVFAAAGLPAPEPAGTLVQRWPTGLPHYRPGHLAAMAAARAAAPDGLALAGAAYEGVGVPSCIASARRGARRIVAHLGR